MIKRRQRLSTISSDFFDENADSPRHFMNSRRKSSNFDMLCDPIKYQDYVKKYLDGMDEIEDQIGGRPFRKRTRSNNFFNLPPVNQLHEIDEEEHDMPLAKQRPSNDQQDLTEEEYQQIMKN